MTITVTAGQQRPRRGQRLLQRSKRHPHCCRGRGAGQRHRRRRQLPDRRPGHRPRQRQPHPQPRRLLHLHTRTRPSPAPTPSPTPPPTAPPPATSPRSPSPTTPGRRWSTCRPPTPAAPSANWTQGDTITFTFSEPIDPSSIVAGWNGTGSTNVVIRVLDTSILGIPTGPDRLEVYNAANSALLPLGSVDLGRNDYVFAPFGIGRITFGATGTPSTMTMSGNTVTIVLGSYNEEGLSARQRRGGYGKDDLDADSGVDRLRGQPARNRLRNRVRSRPIRQRLLTLQRSDKLVAAALV